GVVSVLWALARMARCCGVGIGHGFECFIRKLAEDHRATNWLESGSHGSGEQVGRSDGKNGRCAKHRGGEHRHELVRARRRDFTLRVLAQHRTRLARWNPGFLPGLCRAFYGDGRQVRLSGPEVQKSGLPKVSILWPT